jgi:hypothetical protein
MTARCHNDSCSIKWSEVVVGTGLAYQADLDIYDSSLELAGCPDGGLRVNISEAADNLLSLHADGLFAGYSDANRIELTGYSDAVADNPFIGVGVDAVEAAPAFGTNFQVTNTTGKNGLLMLKGDFSFYYRIAPGLGGGDDASGYPSTAATIGGLANVSMYNAQMAAILATGAAPNPTFRRVRHEFDISGLVRTPPPDNEQYKASVQPFVTVLPVAVGQVVNFRGGAFYNGPSQRTNIAFSSASQANPVRGFRIEDLQAVIIPIPTS